jgi:hypothetical protein
MTKHLEQFPGHRLAPTWLGGVVMAIAFAGGAVVAHFIWERTVEDTLLSLAGMVAIPFVITAWLRWWARKGEGG